jgi:hypothetical protein
MKNRRIFMNYYEKWKEKKISRDEEHKLPRFNSHNEAREYFKNKYGHNNFQMADARIINGEEIYFYELVLDEKAYRKMIEEMASNEFVAMTDEYLFSTQKIEVWADGRIHIIH